MVPGLSEQPDRGRAAARFPAAIWIGHARLSPAELGGLLGGIAVFGYLGWDSPLWDGRLQLALHVIATGAIAAATYRLLRGAQFPRSGLEVPLLLLLVLLGLSSVLGANHGLAAPALASTLAFAALLPIAVFVVHRRPVLAALVVVVPALLTAVAILLQMASRRIGWFSLGIGGLPPVRLGGESTAFGSVAVPPFILLGLIPLCLLIEPRWLRRTAIGLTFVLLVPLAIVSGSRSAWLALGVSVLVYLAPELRRLGRFRPRQLGRRGVAAAIMGTVLLALAVAYVAPRFTAFTSILYRERLWQDTIQAWSVNPLFGIGPGTMPYARQAVSAPFVGPTRQPHSHDLALGVLGDGGILALIAGVAVIAAFFWIAGPQRSRSRTGRTASSILVGFLVAGLVEDLTFLPNFDLIVLLLAAVALLDAGAIRWESLRVPRPALAMAGVAAACLLVVVLMGDAASAAFRNGADAAYASDWRSATRWYELAVALDPSHPSGPKALAVAADMASEPSQALAAARRAVELNPGDGASWTNLAVLCLAAGDRQCAVAAVNGSVRASPTTGRELINGAIVEERLGDHARADELYRLSLLTNQNTALAVSWPRPVDVEAGWVPIPTDGASQLAQLLAHASTGKPANADPSWAPVVRAVGLAINGNRSGAEQALAAAMRESSADPMTWEVASVLELHWGEDNSRAVRAAEFLRGSPLRFSPGPVPQVNYEIASLRAYPRDGLVQSAERLSPMPPWPWALERFLPPRS